MPPLKDQTAVDVAQVKTVSPKRMAMSADLTMFRPSALRVQRHAPPSIKRPRLSAQSSQGSTAFNVTSKAELNAADECDAFLSEIAALESNS